MGCVPGRKPIWSSFLLRSPWRPDLREFRACCLLVPDDPAPADTMPLKEVSGGLFPSSLQSSSHSISCHVELLFLLSQSTFFSFLFHFLCSFSSILISPVNNFYRFLTDLFASSLSLLKSVSLRQCSEALNRPPRSPAFLLSALSLPGFLASRYFPKFPQKRMTSSYHLHPAQFLQSLAIKTIPLSFLHAQKSTIFALNSFKITISYITIHQLLPLIPLFPYTVAFQSSFSSSLESSQGQHNSKYDGQIVNECLFSTNI